MVVLAASICSRGGKTILSRQFRDLSKDRVLSLLANFPTLLSESKSSQNTTIRDENVRYVYQPLEDVYIVLITNRHSNILQDIDTLHLVTETITSLIRTIDEREIFENCFQILSALDEIVNLGYKENLTLPQVKSFLEMDSHEEKIQEIIEKNKELEATEERKRRAKEIQRKELARRVETGFGGGNTSSLYHPDHTPSSYQQLNTYSAQPTISPIPSQISQSSRNPPRRGGLQLGKKNKSISEARQPLLVDPLTPRISSRIPEDYSQSPTGSFSTSTKNAPPSNKLDNNGILIAINEKITAEISRDGSVQASEIKGDLQLRINDSSLAHSNIFLTLDKNSDIQYKTHPNVDKALFNKTSTIGLKDKSKGFPSNDQSLGVLRWRGLGKTDESSFLPLLFSCWVNNHGNGIIDVTVEYETTEKFQDVEHRISEALLYVPAAGFNAVLKEDENDTISIEYPEDGIIFKINKLDAVQAGSFEFSIECEDEEILFPMEAHFSVENGLSNLSNVTVNNVTSIGGENDGEQLPFDLYYNLSSENYLIV
ncbi:hypothetical protein PACTADRAFT_35751 [Pachysolen tannophilus NRRL Y-2460]|uniref:Coatomer subunit delta n=1 Tax=Pachysolen tannophilus NRRL Y-2460 TaxID=669874 RepID=A0A1E4TQL5_PACTA|nr:hypothetical protein PACTADRAFT_35751 [Pachysolen tannophilus NRRL Y-2460]